MRYLFAAKKLKALYEDPGCAHHYPTAVVDAFDEVMATIDAASDERVLSTVRGLKLEKLKGNKKGQWSMRLNQQWRLIVSFAEDEEGRYILIESISPHYE